MKFLWVTAEAPNRSLGGGSIRGSYLLETLAQRADVDLLLATDGAREDEVVAAAMGECHVLEIPAPPPLTRTQQRIRSLVGLTPAGPAERMDMDRHVRKLTPVVAHLLATGGYDVAIANHVGIARVMLADPSATWCLQTQHLASRDLEQLLTIEAGGRQRFLRKAEVDAAKRFESWACHTADLVVTVSDEDSAALPTPTAMVPNGADLERWSALPMQLTTEPRAVFTGTLGYGPNVDGLEWLAAEIWPAVREQIPNAVLDIVGRDPLPHITALGGRDGITVTPNVPDTVPYVTAARVALVPLRFGSGTRLKAIEALASGRIVVGTPIGLEGLGLQDGRDALMAADAPGVISRLVAALRGDAAIADVPDAGRVAASRFGWTELGALHADALLELAGSPALRV